MTHRAALLKRIQEACHDVETLENAGEFDAYRDAYERILGAAGDVGGEGVMTAVAEWIVGIVEVEGALPDPERVRTEARELCVERNLRVPTDSPLADA